MNDSHSALSGEDMAQADDTGAERTAGAVAVIETVSNQAFIFGTNRLREAVGASEMIYAAGVDLVLEALGFSKDEIRTARKPGGLDKVLRKHNGIEPLLIASGKAILLGPQNRLKDVIRKVALAAAERMPGLGVLGGIAPLAGDTDDAKALHDAIRQAHERLATLRARVPSAHMRFQRLPFVAECASSGLPAYGVDSKAPEEDVISEPVCAKRKFREKGRERLCEWLEQENLAGSIDDIDEVLREAEGRWVAVIHADGNGLGEIFLDFLNRSKAGSRKDYIRKYQAFSLALDTCTIKAAKKALAEVFRSQEREDEKDQQRQQRQQDKKLPFIPLIIGGDDLTVICDGAHAEGWRRLAAAAHSLRARPGGAGFMSIAVAEAAGCAPARAQLCLSARAVGGDGAGAAAAGPGRRACVGGGCGHREVLRQRGAYPPAAGAEAVGSGAAGAAAHWPVAAGLWGRRTRAGAGVAGFAGAGQRVSASGG